MDIISRILENSGNITTLVGICSFALAITFLAYYFFLKHKDRTVSALPEDERTKLLSDWFNLNIESLTKQQTFELAKAKLKIRYNLVRYCIAAAVLVFITSLFAILTNADADEIKNNESGYCTKRLSELNIHEERKHFSIIIETLSELYRDPRCSERKIEIARKLGYSNRDLNKFELALSWHKKSFELAEETEEDSIIARAASILGYAYDGLEQWDDAIHYHGIAKEKSLPDTSTHRSAIYAIANNYLVKYHSFKEKDLIDKSLRGFNLYVKQVPFNHFAHLNLACISAYNASSDSAVIDILNRAVDTLELLPRRDRYNKQIKYLGDVVKNPDEWTYEATWPYPCPPLVVSLSETPPVDVISRIDNLISEISSDLSE